MPRQLNSLLAVAQEWESRIGILARLFWSKSTRLLKSPKKLVMMLTVIAVLG